MNRLSSLFIESDPYLSCDECFERVDEEVDEFLESAKPFSKELLVHLNACPECHEEALSLLELLGVVSNGELG